MAIETFCAVQYEPGARPHDTHTCCLEYGHKIWHQCPLCGGEWDKLGGQVVPAGRIRECDHSASHQARLSDDHRPGGVQLPH